MTDEQIIKALEEHVSFGKRCKSIYVSIEVDALKNALDLINRQKAEIERLQKHIQEGVDLAKQIPEMLAMAQAEAIKDFAERLLKEGLENVVKYTPEGCDLYFKNGTLCGYSAMKEVIDNLVKEMTGEQE